VFSAATRLHVAIYLLLHGGIFAETLHAGKTRSLLQKVRWYSEILKTQRLRG